MRWGSPDNTIATAPLANTLTAQITAAQQDIQEWTQRAAELESEHYNLDNWKRNNNAEIELMARELEQLAVCIRGLKQTVDPMRSKTLMEQMLDENTTKPAAS